MKRIAFFIWSFVVTCTGQNYLNHSASWWQQLSWSGSGGQSSLSRLHYFLQGDTMVGNQIYYKVVEEGYSLFKQQKFDSLGNPFFETDSTPFYRMRTLLREENKKFIELQVDGMERLLYNFEVEVGYPADSIVSTTLCPQSNTVMLQSQDRVCIGNQSRKRWMLSPTQFPAATSLIEGVGPNTGLFSPLCRNGCPECGYQLLYFVLDGDTLYQGNCDLSSNLSETISQTFLQIKYGSQSLEIDIALDSEINLCDLMGKTLLLSKDTQHAIVLYDDLPSGYYILQVNNASGREHRLVWVP